METTEQLFPKIAFYHERRGRKPLLLKKDLTVSVGWERGKCRRARRVSCRVRRCRKPTGLPVSSGPGFGWERPRLGFGTWKRTANFCRHFALCPRSYFAHAFRSFPSGTRPSIPPCTGGVQMWGTVEGAGPFWGKSTRV